MFVIKYIRINQIDLIPCWGESGGRLRYCSWCWMMDDGDHAVDDDLWFWAATFHAPLQTLIGIDDICKILAPEFGQITLNLWKIKLKSFAFCKPE